MGEIEPRAGLFARRTNDCARITDCGIRSPMQRDPDVLIVGAGPTGLALAFLLTRLGVAFGSRQDRRTWNDLARAVARPHARILPPARHRRQLVEGGTKFAGVNLWVNGRQVRALPLSRHRRGRSAASRYADLSAGRAREMLDRAARDAECTSNARPSWSVSTSNRRRRESAARRSTARRRPARRLPRRLRRRPFESARGPRHRSPRRDYADLFYVADVEATGPATNGEVHVALDDADFLVYFR